MKRCLETGGSNHNAVGWSHGFLSNICRCKMAFWLNYAQRKIRNGSEDSHAFGIRDGGTELLLKANLWREVHQMTKRERERQARREQEQRQEELRRDKLLAKVLEEIKSNRSLHVTPEEAGRLILDASKLKKHRGPISIRTFRG